MPTRPSNLRVALVQGAEALALLLDDEQVTRLLDYLALLQKWGSVYNLTAVRDPQDMLVLHLLDSLAVVPALRRHLSAGAPVPGVRVLDVGSGAGLPGVVIAVCCPDLAVSCVDKVAKKAAFVRQVAASLSLPNLRGLHARVEALTERFDVVVSRAFASLPGFIDASGSALADGGAWLAMKGRLPLDELASVPREVEVFHVEQLQVPGLHAERCLVWMRRAAPA